jgi:hypothetical protein
MSLPVASRELPRFHPMVMPLESSTGSTGAERVSEEFPEVESRMYLSNILSAWEVPEPAITVMAVTKAVILESNPILSPYAAGSAVDSAVVK